MLKLEPIHPYAYRREDGELPEITDILNFKPENLEARMCVEVTYKDGFKDYIPVSEIGNGCYKVVKSSKMQDIVDKLFNTAPNEQIIKPLGHETFFQINNINELKELLNKQNK